MHDTRREVKTDTKVSIEKIYLFSLDLICKANIEVRIIDKPIHRQNG